MKVLLVQFTPYSMVSYGLLSLADALSLKGFDVRIVGNPIGIQHLLEQPEHRDVFLGVVRDFRPDVVGLSTMTPDADPIGPFCRVLREHLGEVPIICGGYHTLVFKGKVLEENPLLDFAFCGEAEEEFPRFLEQMKSSRPDYAGIRGLVYRDGGSVVVNDVPEPVDFEHLVPLRAYRELTVPETREVPGPPRRRRTTLQPMLQPNVPFLLSRGCPYKCSFCQLYPDNPYARVRHLSAESFRRQLEYALEWFHPRSIFIHDSALNLNRSWAAQIVQVIRETREIQEWCCYIRPNLADEGFFRLIRDARCSLVMLYLEGGTERVRNDVLKKKVTDEQVRNAFRLADKYGLYKKTNMILGCPTETVEEMTAGVRFLGELRPGSAGFPILTVIPGTELWDHYEDRIVVKAYSDFNYSRAAANVLRDDIRINFSEIPPDELVRRKVPLNVHFECFSTLCRDMIAVEGRSILFVQTHPEDSLGRVVGALFNEHFDYKPKRISILFHKAHDFDRSYLTPQMEVIGLDVFPAELEAEGKAWAGLERAGCEVLIAAVSEETDETLAGVIRLAALLRIRTAYFINAIEETLYSYDLKQKSFSQTHINTGLRQLTRRGLTDRIEKQQVMIANRDRGIRKLKALQEKYETMIANRDRGIEKFKALQEKYERVIANRDRTIEKLKKKPKRKDRKTSDV